MRTSSATVAPDPSPRDRDAAPSVLLLTDADVFAGTERHILDLALGLRDNGLRVRIACPVPSPLARRADDHRLPLVDLPRRGPLDLNAVRTLRRLLDAGDVDVLHAHNGRTHLTAAIAVARARRGACVATQHFLHPSHVSRRGLKGLASRCAHGWVNARTAHFIAISNAVREQMLLRRQAPANRITVVQNGVCDPDVRALTPAPQVRAQLGIGPDDPMILCAARLEPEKDIPSLVTAMCSVRDACPNARCYIAGHGSEESRIQAHIRSVGLETHVAMLGFRADVPSLINAADLFVLPSLAEPFGLVLLEAMALTRPVVATRAGGPVEIICQGQTGALVPPAAPTALAQAILAIIAEPDRARQMGVHGRQRYLARFTAARMARDTCDVYARLAPAAPHRRSALEHETCPV
jgi:glycosyltransferase involved in cell wall biosynthesis